MQHALTVDVEDSFNILMHDFFSKQTLPTAAVVRNSMRLMEIIGEYNIRATFFVLGEVAQTFPSLVRRIADQGHEVGVHGYSHRQFFRMSPGQALVELCRAKKIIEDITGHRARGHRAPAFSIRPDTAWALETVAEAGFDYDSSIVPCKMRRYGWPGFPKDIHNVVLPSGATIVEAPLSTITILGRGMPVCGGGYLRHFPLFFTRWALRQVQKKRPAIVYIHPYEIDTGPFPEDIQAHFDKAARKKKMSMHMQMIGRRTVEKKLRRLFAENSFLPLAEIIDHSLKSRPDSAP